MWDVAKSVGLAKSHPVVRRMTFQGIPIAIETDRGQDRHWDHPDTHEHGVTKFHVPYGYFCGSQGIDKDTTEPTSALDVFVGPSEKADMVYCIHQKKYPHFKEWDEYKYMIGFDSAKEAKDMYLRHFNDKRFFGEMTAIPIEEFKEKHLKKSEDEHRIIDFHGVQIVVETEKDEFRHTKTRGLVKMHYPYGHITDTKSKGDGGKIDVYIGPNLKADKVYIVHQMRPPHFVHWDEDKFFIGFESLKQAKISYLVHFSEERYLGGIDTMSVEEFKDNIFEKAFSDYPPTPAGIDPRKDKYEWPIAKARRVPMLPGIIGHPIGGGNVSHGAGGKFATHDKAILRTPEVGKPAITAAEHNKMLAAQREKTAEGAEEAPGVAADAPVITEKPPRPSASRGKSDEQQSEEPPPQEAAAGQESAPQSADATAPQAEEATPTAEEAVPAEETTPTPEEETAPATDDMAAAPSEEGAVDQTPTDPSMMMMMPMGPPPLDSVEGPDYYLGQVGSMSDDQLKELASEIWGEAYQYNVVNPAIIRAEIVGFLLDQKDLVEASMMSYGQSPETPQPSPNTSISSPALSTGPESMEDQSMAPDYDEVELAQMRSHS